MIVGVTPAQQCPPSAYHCLMNKFRPAYPAQYLSDSSLADSDVLVRNEPDEDEEEDEDRKKDEENDDEEDDGAGYSE